MANRVSLPLLACVAISLLLARFVARGETFEPVVSGSTVGEMRKAQVSGTSAEGWLDRAVRFWEKSIR